MYFCRILLRSNGDAVSKFKKLKVSLSTRKLYIHTPGSNRIRTAQMARQLTPGDSNK